MTRLLLAVATALTLAAPAVPATAGPCGGGGALEPVCALDPRPLVGCYQPYPHYVEFCV